MSTPSRPLALVKLARLLATAVEDRRTGLSVRIRAARCGFTSHTESGGEDLHARVVVGLQVGLAVGGCQLRPVGQGPARVRGKSPGQPESEVDDVVVVGGATVGSRYQEGPRKVRLLHQLEDVDHVLPSGVAPVDSSLGGLRAGLVRPLGDVTPLGGPDVEGSNLPGNQPSTTRYSTVKLTYHAGQSEPILMEYDPELLITNCITFVL